MSKMQQIVDLHLHSHFSRATSPALTVEGLYKWGKIKGINVIGTADFTHPAWFQELREKLEPAELGLYQLKPALAKKIDLEIPQSCRHHSLRFVLTVEISNIYSKNNKVRKLHNVLVVPSFQVASYIISRLEQIGNLHADGRPILGLDSKELLKITLASHPDSLFIPAHIWTPWFSLFGSKSGFDSLEEAFDELADRIVAVETGLSSDPFMNWRLSGLDGITLLSNSDAHSLQNLGREANIIQAALTYQELIGAIKTNDSRFVGTIEFFPQEGKYHHDGHRSCEVSCSPQESQAHHGLCFQCGKPLTLGVEYRVDQLADRDALFKPSKHKSVEYIIPLAEIICEVVAVKNKKAQRVQNLYSQLIATFGNEFEILRNVPCEYLAKKYPIIALAVEKMRNADIVIKPGFDGVFGKVSIFKPGELENKEQQGLFDRENTT